MWVLKQEIVNIWKPYYFYVHIMHFCCLLETQFNAACLDLSIILVFNLKNRIISEMDVKVLPFELEKFLLFEPCV
jgi:Na+-translocating ferredoxin:NAD+ oxidoreductase RnfE subunit